MFPVFPSRKVRLHSKQKANISLLGRNQQWYDDETQEKFHRNVLVEIITTDVYLAHPLLLKLLINFQPQ